MTIETTQTVREIVQQNPASVPVFEALGIDYCCGGGRSLEDACRSKNIALGEVLSRIEEAKTRPSGEGDPEWQNAPLGELADRIVEKHHSYATRELTRLSALAEKVFLRHGERHPSLEKLRDLVNALAAEMCAHMLKEEQVLFPTFKLMEKMALSGAAMSPYSGSLANPINRMMEDHDDTGELFNSIRQLTNNYVPPVGACMSYQALYHGLADLERDLHMHIHLENNILFPRALEIAQSR